MNIGIIGSSGRLGAVLYKILNKEHSVLSCEKKECDKYVIENSDLVFLCVPFKETMDIISKFNENNKLIEVTSIKTPFKKFKGKITSIHPLFGPYTFNKNGFKNIIFINDISPYDKKHIVEGIFPSYNILEMSADEHDRFVSIQLVLPYILSILSSKYTSEKAMTFSMSILKKINSIYINENREALYDTIIYNPYSLDIIKSLSSELEKLGGVMNDIHS